MIANPWAEPLYRFPSPYDYRIMHGGRGSSKTYEVTQALIVLGHIMPLRICVAREHLNSIDESAYPELEDRARSMGLISPDCYTFGKTSINHANGTHIFFVGLSKISEENIKGLAMVDILWNEEAHRTSKSSWELVYPTIRKDNAEIWLTFNPQYRYQVAWKLVEDHIDNPRYWIKKVTWRDNEHFTARNNRDRLQDKEENSLRYDHVWEGEPDDASAARKVLPYGILRSCVDAWDLRPTRGAFGTSGFDVADTGADANALAQRFGPELFAVDTWHGSDDFTVSDSSRRAAEWTVKNGITRIDYDAGGVDPVRGPIREWIRDSGAKLYANPCRFGGKVQGEEVLFERARPRSVTNKMYFHNFGSQAGMVIRMRADNTIRLAKGERVDPGKCLFINPEMPCLDDFLREMSQAEWKDDTGKIRIDKQPHGPGEQEPPSPDMFDAARLSFSYDARNGLRATSGV